MGIRIHTGYISGGNHGEYMPDLLRFDRVQLCLLSSLWLLLAAAEEGSCDGEMLLLRGIRCASRLRRRNLLVA